MQISWSQLLHLPVVTQSGQKIGVVEGVTLDVGLHAVSQYEVKPGGAVAALLRKTFLVSPAEVISITAEQMTVKDTVTPVQATSGAKTRLVLSRPEAGIEMSETE